MLLHWETGCHCQAAFCRFGRFWRMRDCCGLWDVGWLIWLTWLDGSFDGFLCSTEGRSGFAIWGCSCCFVVKLSWAANIDESMKPSAEQQSALSSFSGVHDMNALTRFVWTMKLHVAKLSELLTLLPRALRGASQPHQHGDHAPQPLEGPAEIISNLWLTMLTCPNLLQLLKCIPWSNSRSVSPNIFTFSARHPTCGAFSISQPDLAKFKTMYHSALWTYYTM